MIELILASIIAFQDCPNDPSAGCSGHGSLTGLYVEQTPHLYYPRGPQGTVPPDAVIAIYGNFYMLPDDACCMLIGWEMTVDWPAPSFDCQVNWTCTGAGYPEECLEWCDGYLTPPLQNKCLKTIYPEWVADGHFTVNIDFTGWDDCLGPVTPASSAGHGYHFEIDHSLPTPTAGDFTLDGVVDLDDIIWSITGWHWDINGVDGLVAVILNWTPPQQMQEWVTTEDLYDPPPPPPPTPAALPTVDPQGHILIHRSIRRHR